MEYKRFGDAILVRIDRGEEIMEQLKRVCEAESILLASVEAIGAVREFTVGVLDPAEKVFRPNQFQGVYEITSLSGNVSTMDGAYYAHLHMSAGDESGHVVGGHLNRAVVSATCEMILRVIDGQIDRRFDPDVGLNVFRFD